jgi:hypothetical protein
LAQSEPKSSATGCKILATSFNIALGFAEDREEGKSHGDNYRALHQRPPGEQFPPPHLKKRTEKRDWPSDCKAAQLAYPANAETRRMIQRVTVAEYEKIVGKEEPVPGTRSASERLRALEQLKTDGLINEEEYDGKRKEILGEL